MNTPRVTEPGHGEDGHDGPRIIDQAYYIAAGGLAALAISLAPIAISSAEAALDPAPNTADSSAPFSQE